MPIVKTFSVGDGDTFYVQHGSDNFTMIDCNLDDGRKEEIVDEIIEMSSDKGIARFVSTHPDDDHLKGIEYLDERKPIANFYCGKNAATKEDETESFKHYKTLRNGDKAFHLAKDCSRLWINEGDDERGSSGINILWPKVNNQDYKDALEKAANGESPNNISIVAHYAINEGATFCWFGDLETAFMENIHDDIDLRHAAIIFAPHHGRKSGRLPQNWLDDIKPKIIVVGEAPSQHLEYYQNFNTIKQNSAGDVTFDCDGSKIHIYCSSDTYSEDFLDDEEKADAHGGYYIGSLRL